MNTKEAYRFYLIRFPRGRKTNVALAKLGELDQNAEDEFWKNALTLRNKESIQSYLDRYPSGRHSTEASDLIRRIDWETETLLWTSSERINQKNSYLDYLTRYPWGTYSVVARLRLAKLGMPTPEVVGVVITNSIGMEFTWIPAGTFGGLREQRRDIPNDLPSQKQIAINQGFWLGKYEVTQEQFAMVMNRNPSVFKACGERCPVEQVSWSDAKEFIRRLNKLDDGLVYSLPTEAEWEYSARAGTDGLRYGNLSQIAWYGDNSGSRPINSTRLFLEDSSEFFESYREAIFQNRNRPQSIGRKAPNAWGLFDMLGNVSEWVEDIYQSSYTGLPTDGSANLTRGNPSVRVLRGGSWYQPGYASRAGVRSGNLTTMNPNTIGFRVAARPKQ